MIAENVFARENEYSAFVSSVNSRLEDLQEEINEITGGSDPQTATNTANIARNTSAIAQNLGNINTNRANIAANKTLLDQQVTRIGSVDQKVNQETQNRENVVRELRTRSDDGDKLDFSIITTSDQLTQALNDQENQNNTHRLLISLTAPTAFIESATHGTGRLLDGQIIELAPRSSSPERSQRIVQHKNLEFVHHEVSDATTFNNLVTAQISNPAAIIIEPLADYTVSFAGVDTQVKIGELWHIVPYGTVGHRILSLQDALKRLGIGQPSLRVETAGGRAGIHEVAALDGSYWAEVRDLPSRYASATRFTVNVADDDDTILGGTSVHDQSGWTYSPDFDFAFVVSGAEEAQSRLQQALATTPGYANLVLRFWESNVNIGDNLFYHLPINAIFEPPSGNEDETARRNAKAAQDKADANALLIAGKQDALTQFEQIGLMDFTPDHAEIVYANGQEVAALTRTINWTVGGRAALKGNIWFSGQINGVPIISRTLWASQATIAFVINSGNAGLIAPNVTNALDMRLDFHDAASGGNLVRVVRRSIGLQELPAMISVQKVANEAAYNAITSKVANRFYYVAKT